MAQPPAYIPVHSFVSDSATLANFPGQALDVEFQDIKSVTDAIRTNLSLIQRDDGGLANGTVGYDQLSVALQLNGISAASAWLTGIAYVVGTGIVQSGNLYRCLVAHTSGIFATDLAAGKWIFVVAISNMFGTGTSAAGNLPKYTDTTGRNVTDSGVAVTSLAPLASPTFMGVPAAPTAAVDTNSAQLATTAFVLGQAGSASPLINGVASNGTSNRYARQDHVHPTDTTRAPLASPTFTGVPAAPTATPGTNTTQLATTAYADAISALKANLAGDNRFSGNQEIGANVAPDSLLAINANTGASVAPAAGTNLHVIGADAANNQISMDGYGGSNILTGRVALGTQASKSVVGAGGQLLVFQGQGWDSTNYFNGAKIEFRATETWGATAHGAEVALRTTPNTTTAVADALVVKNSGGLAIGNGAADPGINNLNVSGAIFTKAPVTLTGTAGTVGASDSSTIVNASGAFTLTLPAAATNTGRWVNIKSIAAQTVASASSNVVPRAGGAAGTALLVSGAGNWAALQSDGTNWIIMAGS